MHLGRPKVPPKTAPQESSGVPPVFASRRPRSPPATAPKQQSTVPPVVAPKQSNNLSIPEGLKVLWALLIAKGSLADYDRASHVYKAWRRSPKYSTLGPDASEAELKEESHRIALSIATEAAMPSAKYSIEGPALDVYDLGVREYSVFLPEAAPDSTIEKPVPPPNFLKKPRTLAHIEDQCEADRLLGYWEVANRANAVTSLKFLAKCLNDLYLSYQSEGHRSQVASVGASFAGKPRPGSGAVAACPSPLWRRSGSSSLSESIGDLHLSPFRAILGKTDSIIAPKKAVSPDR